MTFQRLLGLLLPFPSVLYFLVQRKASVIVKSWRAPMTQQIPPCTLQGLPRQSTTNCIFVIVENKIVQQETLHFHRKRTKPNCNENPSKTSIQNKIWRKISAFIWTSLLNLSPSALEFFLIEFYKIYRICTILFLIIWKMKITRNCILQILKNPQNTIFIHFKNEKND